ncbi:hypothetical protein [Candidatus Phytoplasma pruni]|uniref:Uncharacterized protein n=1 Tax=Candidatus Phytoplasma pruni TaxID=479893 RepID=A0A851HKQ6_9MOLU|nr:hypothetical protein [Candidatus Phytoplasma pruni]NWN46009.1 hypothetical protein [Candidatus Phytoplasma pruni]
MNFFKKNKKVILITVGLIVLLAMNIAAYYHLSQRIKKQEEKTLASQPLGKKTKKPSSPNNQNNPTPANLSEGTNSQGNNEEEDDDQTETPTEILAKIKELLKQSSKITETENVNNAIINREKQTISEATQKIKNTLTQIEKIRNERTTDKEVKKIFETHLQKFQAGNTREEQELAQMMKFFIEVSNTLQRQVNSLDEHTTDLSNLNHNEKDARTTFIAEKKQKTENKYANINTIRNYLNPFAAILSLAKDMPDEITTLEGTGQISAEEKTAWGEIKKELPKISKELRKHIIKSSREELIQLLQKLRSL